MTANACFRKQSTIRFQGKPSAGLQGKPLVSNVGNHSDARTPAFRRRKVWSFSNISHCWTSVVFLADFLLFCILTLINIASLLLKLVEKDNILKEVLLVSCCLYCRG